MEFSGTWYNMREKSWNNGITFEPFPGAGLVTLSPSSVGVKYNKWALSIVYGFANKY